MKRLVVLVGLAMVMLGVAACSSSTGGQPTVGATTEGGPTSSDSTSGSPPSTGAGALPVDQPCSLLSSADLMQLGVSTPASADMVGTAHVCEMDTAADHLAVAIRTDLGLSQFQASGGTIQDTTIGSHPAKQVIDNTGSCIIGIGITDSSRVDVTVTAVDTTNPCPVATTVANLVAPKLP